MGLKPLLKVKRRPDVNLKRKYRLIHIILILVVCTGGVMGQELLEMPNPTHTEKGVPTAQLTTVKIIEPDFDKDLFFAMPWRMAVSKKDKNGRFFLLCI